MRALISVIISKINAQRYLSKLFVSLLEGLDAGLIRAVIVSDAGSSDKTCEIAL